MGEIHLLKLGKIGVPLTTHRKPGLGVLVFSSAFLLSQERQFGMATIEEKEGVRGERRGPKVRKGYTVLSDVQDVQCKIQATKCFFCNEMLFILLF